MVNNTIKGGVLFSTVIVALLSYYFIWHFEPVGAEVDPEIPDSSARPDEGEHAPDFTYATVDGREIRLSDYIGVKPVVLDFWATWCRPCMEELPLLQAFYEEYGDQVEIIAITSEDARLKDAIANTINQKELTFPVMHDPSRGISNLYPTRAIPYLVFIDIDGKVTGTHTGMSPSIGEDILEEFGIDGA
ncbi:TlpA family protein disulfide reductase [bacterium]|nr:TlpA family protein disulfide reductase [bacterium]